MNGADRRSILKTAVCLGLALPLVDLGAIHTAVRGEPDPTTMRPQGGDQLVFSARERKREAVTPARVPLGGPPLMAYPMDPATKIVRDGSYMVDGVQYIAVQSGWGVDAQRMQARLDTFLGTKTDVPQGGVIWVFALGD